MQSLQHQEQQPVAKARMLIRRPAAEVFRALTQPELLTQFWLSDASGPLEAERTVQWHFMVPGVTERTTVTLFEPDRRVRFDWSDGTTVDWRLETRAQSHTLVEVCNSGFKGSEPQKVEQALEATQGFTIVLCDLKTLLEHGRPLNLTRDKALLIEERQRPVRST